MSKLKVNKEVIVGYASKDDEHRIKVSYVDSSYGEFISIQDQYQEEDSTEWSQGKGKWIPLAQASEVNKLIEKAVIAAQEEK